MSPENIFRLNFNDFKGSRDPIDADFRAAIKWGPKLTRTKEDDPPVP